MSFQLPSPLDARPSTLLSDDEVLVRVEGVSKKFCRSLKKSLWYGVCDIAGELLPRRKRRETRDEGRELSDGSAQDISRSPLDAGLSTSSAPALDSSCSAKALDSGPSTLDSSSGLRAGEFFAVKDVSFELRRGECLGLIGHNGAGKTTLLKMLNGLIKPDWGTITMRGRVGALIALGAGFNPILTGRENIYINGSVLGLTKKEIDEKIDEIIDFAEIREFIDMPVQSYSSGMTVRLGFAVAANLSPDILILDEVLAVGDMAFQAKCLNTLGKLRAKGTTFLFVSHHMLNVARHCTSVMFMRGGKPVFIGNTAEGIRMYEDDMSHRHANSSLDGEPKHTGNGDVKIKSVHFSKDSGETCKKIQSGEPLSVIIEYKKKSDRNQFLKVEVTIRDREGVLHRVDGSDPLFLNGKSGDVGKIRCRFDTLVMNSSKIAFSILLWDSETNELCDWKKDIYLDSQAVPASDGRVYLPHKVEIIS